MRPSAAQALKIFLATMFLAFCARNAALDVLGYRWSGAGLWIGLFGFTAWTDYKWVRPVLLWLWSGKAEIPPDES